MAALFAFTLFVSAVVLFAIQPLAGKMVLPLLGGTPAVWNTCLVFFQTTLLGGYTYAFAVRRLGRRRQALLHGVLLLLAGLTLSLVTLPLGLRQEALAGGTLGFSPLPALLALLERTREQLPPVLWLFLLLFLSLGLPLLVVASTAPLLQEWFAGTGHASAPDPYYLYTASNLGSLAALWGYVTLLEPNLPLADQTRLWRAACVLLGLLIAGCAVLARRFRTVPSEEPAHSEPSSSRVPWRQLLAWMALALVPSSLLFGVTTYASTDIAAIPLLWVIPLSLYLLTFVLAFARFPWIPPQFVVMVLPLVLLLQVLGSAPGWVHPIWVPLLLHLAAFFVVALACHGELARRRPPARHLTRFYLAIAAGGVLGGLFNTLLAPLLFTSTAEYPLMLLLGYLVVPRPHAPEDQTPKINSLDIWLPLVLGVLLATLLLGIRFGNPPGGETASSLLLVLAGVICYTFARRQVRFVLGLGALMLISGIGGRIGPSQLVEEERNFFGTVRVVDRASEDSPGLVIREFIHGTTIHGKQRIDPDPARRREPLTYYFRDGPMGQIFQDLPPDRRRVAVLGLGVGTLASYAEARQEWTFFEIDPAVLHIADAYFTYLADARERGVAIRVELGDARLFLARTPDHSLDLIFADAFSSDAVPVHLLTRQALQLYRTKLTAGGVIVWNAQNRYLDLEPVLGDLAADAGLVCRARQETAAEISSAEKQQGKTPCHWVVMAQSEKDLGALASSPEWKAVTGRPGARVWTDDFSNLLSIIQWH